MGHRACTEERHGVERLERLMKPGESVLQR